MRSAPDRCLTSSLLLGFVILGLLETMCPPSVGALLHRTNHSPHSQAWGVRCMQVAQQCRQQWDTGKAWKWCGCRVAGFGVRNATGHDVSAMDRCFCLPRAACFRDKPAQPALFRIPPSGLCHANRALQPRAPFLLKKPAMEQRGYIPSAIPTALSGYYLIHLWCSWPRSAR